jgi:hypothetical protein
MFLKKKIISFAGSRLFMIFNRQQIFKTFIALLLLVVFIAPSLNQLIPCCEKEKSSVCLEKKK